MIRYLDGFIDAHTNGYVQIETKIKTHLGIV
jgi:hypothetical protein